MTKHGKQARSVEVASEALDDLDDTEAEFLDGVAPKLSVAEDYFDGECAVHVHMRFAPSLEAVAHEYCAIFQRAVLVDDLKPTVDGFVSKTDLRLGGVPHDSESTVEEAVLVHVGGLNQLGEGAPNRMVPSKVRLQVLDACPVVVADSTEHRVEPLNGRGAFRVDRELAATGRFLSIQADQLPDQVVEGGPKVMNDFGLDPTTALTLS